MCVFHGTLKMLTGRDKRRGRKECDVMGKLKAGGWGRSQGGAGLSGEDSWLMKLGTAVMWGWGGKWGSFIPSLNASTGYL